MVQDVGNRGPQEIRRCGTCKNCKELERVKKRVLASVNPPFSSATDAMGRSRGVVELWNMEIDRLPCLGSTRDSKEL